MKPLKIAIVVQGRFHAFDLARALLALGHDVTVFTNYPRWATSRFGLPPERVRSFVAHGVADRLLSRLPTHGPIRYPEVVMHETFGRWAAGQLGAESWDVIHCWSGVSEEILKSRNGSRVTLLMRGSAHIVAQGRLLRDEEVRAGMALDGPSPWMTAREQREYGLADHVLVLSTFARQTFEAEGFPPEKLTAVPLGVDLAAFRPGQATIVERQRRIRAGEPLNVLYVGAVSFRKGLLDLERAIHALHGARFSFTIGGPALAEAAGVLARLQGKAGVLGKLPQADLPSVYHRADVFLFPTIEDGFASVLAQAKAAGLPIITTPHGAGSDLVTTGLDGWVVPIRDAGAIVDRLHWCDANRESLAAMAAAVYNSFPPRDWRQVAEEFDRVCQGLLAVAPQARHA